MKILIISDTHGKHSQLREFPEADLFIHCGDFSNVGKETETKDFFNWVSVLNYKYKVIIPGNHDLCSDPERNRNMSWFYNLIKEFNQHGKYYLHNSGCNIEGYNIWGSGVTPSFFRPHWAHNKDRGQEIKKYWDQIPFNTDILITHGPPYMKCDYIPSQYGNYGEYVGCTDLLYRVQEIKPLINCFGHIHCGHGIDKDENTTYINASLLNDNYIMVNKSWLIEINNNREIKIQDSLNN